MKGITRYIRLYRIFVVQSLKQRESVWNKFEQDILQNLQFHKMLSLKGNYP